VPVDPSTQPRTAARSGHRHGLLLPPVAIVGARQASHVQGSLAAADVSVSDADLDEIEQIMSFGAPVAGPSPEGM
jgi:diketogulonate reductase-like aldo/keto reductase